MPAEIVARFHLEPRHLKGKDLVVLVHAPEPVGQPAGAGFEKNHLQLRKFFQDPFANQAQAGEHLFEGMGNRVGKKPLAGKAIGAGGGKIGA